MMATTSMEKELRLSNFHPMVSFSRCTGISIGTIYNCPPQTEIQETDLDRFVYKRTETINLMMRSKESLSPSFLNYISGYFGQGWKKLTILLDIDQLEVERFFEDYFNDGRTQEVMYRVLTAFFRINNDKATVGWFTKFLWKNGFRKTIHSIKERYKELFVMENCDDEQTSESDSSEACY